MNGVLNVYKEQGFTSHDVVAKLRGILKTKKKKEKTRVIVNPKIENFLEAVFAELKDNGIDKTITKKNIKSLYKKYCIDDKTEYVYEFHGEWKKA